MRKLFNIDQDEKNRILEMHETATKRHYLNEQGVKQTPPSNGLTPAELRATKIIQDKIEQGEQMPVVILPENPRIAYQYPYEVKQGEQPYWANGLFVYVSYPGKVGDKNIPGSQTIAPYAGHLKTVSMGENNRWTSESYQITSPKPADVANIESVVGKNNFATMINGAFNQLDENSKNIVKQYVANTKEFPQTYKQIIANA